MLQSRRGFGALGAFFVVVFVALAMSVGAVFFAFWLYGHDLPSTHGLKGYRPLQINRVLDRNGALIGTLFKERRTVVPLKELPRVMVLCVLAAEDADFFRHPGFDYPGMLRALFHTLMQRKVTQGASTITQQVVKNVLLTPERTFRRKIRELILARRLEQELAKEEILELYLNLIYFGHGRYGIEEASQYYFGKSARELNLGEAALLAGIPKAPSHLSPFVDINAALARREVVLTQIAQKRTEYWPDLPLAEIARARAQPPVLSQRTHAESKHLDLLMLAKQELIRRVGQAEFDLGGYTVSMAVDLAVQTLARQALQHGLREYAARHRPQEPKKSAKKKTTENIPSQAKSAQSPEGAVVVIDPHTRAVMAVVGGVVSNAGFNRALQAKRQPGSTFKAFVYGLALQSKRYTPASLMADAPQALVQWQPRNFEPWNYATAIRLRQALAQSINMVAVQLIYELTPQNVAWFAKNMGITSKLLPVPSLALGTSEVTVLELTNAYATFAAKGLWQPARLIERIVGLNKQDLYVAAREDKLGKHVLTPAEAYLVTSMLTSVVQEGTAKAALALGQAAAGKTGTSNDARDTWFVGYTPRFVVGVWVGFDDFRSLGKNENGSRTALPIWIDTMRALEGESPKESFPIPDGVVTVAIDPLTGLLATENTVGSFEEVFLEGTVPTEMAPPSDLQMDAGVSVDATPLPDAESSAEAAPPTPLSRSQVIE